MSNLDRFSESGVIYLKLMPFLDNLPERFSAFVFTVRQENMRLRFRKGIEPMEQVALTGVAAQTAEGVHRRANRNLLTEDGHRWLAVDDHPSERTVPLISDEQHGRASSGEIVAKVME